MPNLDIKTNHNHSPHVVILGAGASRACCPDGDKFHQKLPLMNDFIETLNLKNIIKELNFSENNFELIYSEAIKQNRNDIIQNLNAEIGSYFSKIQISKSPTLYDYLILSLRQKDAIITFNWDPLLVQAYKRWRHLGKVLPQLFFLHGNIDVGYDLKQKSVGFLSDGPYNGHYMEPSPLLFPVDNKDYNANPFISEQWRASQEFISKCYFLTIFGYSAPISDVEAKSLLLSAWKQNAGKWIAHIALIDLKDPKEIMNSWSNFIQDESFFGVNSDLSTSALMSHPRRSCESLAWANLQQDPWGERPMPKFYSLKELEEWVAPLIDEEQSGVLKKTLKIF